MKLYSRPSVLSLDFSSLSSARREYRQKRSDRAGRELSRFFASADFATRACLHYRERDVLAVHARGQESPVDRDALPGNETGRL
jgi:hypothetical protein